MKPMRIRVTTVIELTDPQQWADTYGTEATPAAIREDVKSWAGNALQQAAPFGTDEVEGEVSWY